MQSAARAFTVFALSLACAASAFGQPFVRTTGFEEFPLGDQVIWQEPGFSGSTAGIVPGDDPFGNPINNAQVFECDGSFCLPSPAYEISMAWEDPTNSNGAAGVRCTTLATPNLPSPSIHLAGKIRFKMAVTVFDFLGTNAIPPFGDQDVSGNPSVLMCLAVRETGNAFALGDPDTGGGDLEYVYLPGSEDIPVAGTNGIADYPPRGKRVHAITNFWPPQAGDFTQYEFDLAEISTLGLVRGFANNGDGTDTAGDGVLDATLNPTGHGVNRGVFESIIFTNDPNDPTGAYFFIYIDDVELISPEEDPVPPPTIVSPIIRGDTSVTVTDVSTSATEVRLIVDNGLDPDQTVDPQGATSVVFTLPHGAVPGDVYTATQTVDGTPSSESIGVPVTFPGPFVGLLPKDGDTTVRVTGIDPNATEVELFVNSNSRSVTVTSNGVFTIDVSAGGTLVMGEEVTVTQMVGGATSDPSPVAIVTTSGIATLFCDDFEYANQAGMDAVWAPTDGDLQLELSTDWNATPGGSKSALSSEVGDHRSGLITEFTPTAGSNTHPVVWNLSFYDEAISPSTYRQYAEVRGALQGTSPLIAMGKYNEFQTGFYDGRVLGLPTQNGWLALNGFNQPNRSIGWHVLTMVFKATTIDFYVDGALAATGLPHSSAQQIATVLIGSGLSSGGGAAYFDDVCVEVGALHFNTITAQPPLPPTIVEPIIPGSPTVTVIDVDTNAELVSLYRNGNPTPVGTQDPAGLDTVNFNVGSAVGGDVYTATQTRSGLESDHSDPVTVLLPGPVLYKAPAHGEDSVRVVDVDTNASLVEVRVNGIPRGSINPAGASDVVVPLSAFTLTMGEVVTARMTVNAIQSADSAPDVVTTNTVASTIWCDDFESYADQAAFQAVYTPITTQMQLSTANNATVGGTKSLFAPVGSPSTRSQGPLQTGAAGTDTNPVVWNINIFDDNAGTGVNQYADLNDLTTDFYLTEIGIASPTFTGTGQPETHYQARLVGNGAPFGTNNGWFHLDKFNAPGRSIGWHTLTVVFKGPPPGETTGHELDFYVDGQLAEKNRVLTTDTILRQARIGSGQATTGAAFFDDYCVEVGPVSFPTIAAQPPNKPTILAPIEDGDTTVTVDNVGPDATLVTVYADGLPIGTLVDGGGTNGVVEVPVTALVHLDAITADQENANGTSLLSDPLEVGKRNGDVLIAIGIRETGDAGPLGSQGGTSGQIEWVGADAVTNGAPQGVSFTPSGKWQTIEFDPATDPITSFTGNGVIDGARGTLEHLAVSVDAGSADRSTGQYTMYVDNVINVGADVGDVDFVITDFEANSNGEEVLFQEPTNSGSTFPDDLTPLPSASEVTSAQASTGQRSAILTWFWKDTTAQRWARITTSATEFVSRPIIDLTKPIRMDILLAPSCMTVPGDADGDGDVDDADVDEFAVCLEGPAEGFEINCECADINGDIHVDLRDYAALQALLGN